MTTGKHTATTFAMHLPSTCIHEAGFFPALDVICTCGGCESFHSLTSEDATTRGCGAGLSVLLDLVPAGMESALAMD
jgi:hypothetical protein